MGRRDFLLQCSSALLICCVVCAAQPGMLSGALSCAQYSGLTIPPAVIQLATSGAKITSATVVPAAQSRVGVTHCLVKGVILPYSNDTLTRTGQLVKSTVITFNVALPMAAAGGGWRNRSLHFGGGGFDGYVVPADQPGLDRGYATIGSDGGNQGTNMLFGDEAAQNYGGAAIKRTHDVAMFIIEQFYGAPSLLNYFIGASQGGHEALAAANYQIDFNGVVSGFPAYGMINMQLSAIDYFKTLHNPHTAEDGYHVPCDAGQGWISIPQSTALTNFILAACDARDGVADGIVSNPGDALCRQRTAVLLLLDDRNPLRCPGASTDHTDSNSTCLSDPQIETLAHFNHRYNHPDLRLDGGLVSFGHFPFQDAAIPPGANMFGTTETAHDGVQDWAVMVPAHIIEQDNSVDPLQFNASLLADRLVEMSGWLDTQNVDFSTFRARGGKIIHYHGNADILITPYNSIDFYLRMSGQFVGNAKYLGDDVALNTGASQQQYAAISAGGIVDDFYSFFLIPGMGHGSGRYVANVDWLAALEAWVEKGIAPTHLTMTATDTSLGSRPLCTFPFYPHFVGTVSNDPKLAANYKCVQLSDFSNLLH